MGNNRNLIIAIALSVLVLVLWQVLVANPQMESARRAAEQAAATQPPIAEAIPPAAPQAEPGAAVAVAPAVCGVTQVAMREEALVQNPRVAIDTPALTGSINLCGARIDDLRLDNYQETIDPDSPTIVLLSPEQGPAAYYAEFGWRRSGAPLVDARTLWTAPAGAVLTTNTPVTLTYDNGAGLIFTRTIAVDEQYMFTVTDAVTNNTGGDVALTPYGRITRADYGSLPQGFFILHEGMIGFLGDQGLKQVDYGAVREEREQYPATTEGWLGFTDKYWAATLIPEQGQSFIGAFEGAPELRRFYADYTSTPRPIANGTTTTVTTNLFAGAKEVAVVDGYDVAMDLPRFELLIDWGWFYFITKPMFTALDWLYRLVGNFGVAILLVTVFLKLVFFPLANRSYRSMAAMRKFTPQIAALRERYKDDRPKQQQAMLELYRKEKINPVAGCWPILIQIPVFFALYKVLFVTLEMRHAPFFGWIQDLSAPDPTSIFNLFGLLPFEPPAFLLVGIWPVIMGITMWAQFQLNPQTPGTPKWIFNILPLVFTFMLASFPAGLVIYWAWNNLLSVIQQSVIMKRNGVDVNLFANIRNTFRRKPKDAKAKT